MKLQGIYKKFITWTTLLAVAMTLCGPVQPASAYTETSKTKTTEILTDGATLDTYNIVTNEGNIKAYVTTVDLTNPYVQVNTLVGSNNVITSNKSVTQMANEAGAVAAINADFFQMDQKAPIGLTVQSGELVTSPAQRTDMYGFGLTKGNVPIFNIFGFQGSVTAPTGISFPLFGVNKPTYLADKGASSDANRLNMYTPRWGAKSRGQINITGGMVEMVVENDVVQQIRVNQPAVAIPFDGYVLAGNGTAAQFLTKNFKVGDTVQATYSVSPQDDELFAAVGGQALLVQNGKRHWFSQNIAGDRARTAVGASADGTKLYLVVVEGSYYSKGMTQEELADFMISIGAANAVNLDGGGSSTISARHLGDWSASLVNRPTAGSERLLPIGLGVFSTATGGPLYGMKISGTQALLTGTKRAFTVKGWDDHFNPFSINQSDVTWSVSPELGYFEGNVFTAVNSGDATITATYNNVTQSYPVKILGSQDISKIEVTPSSLALNPGNCINLNVKVTTKQGGVFNLQPSEYTVQVIGDIGTYENGQFTAGTTMATGQIQVKVDSTVSTVNVSVGGVEKPFYGFETARNFAFRSAPSASVGGGFRLTNENESTFRGAGAARLDYDFTRTSSTRAAYGSFKDPLALPGQPIGIGVWVKGDQGNTHWLRARIVDAAGKEYLVDLARNVNWKGWKHLTANLPAGLKYPVKLTDIYLAEVSGGTKDKGVIFFDEISLIGAPEHGETNATPETLSRSVDVNPAQQAVLKLGDLSVTLNSNSNSPVYSVNAQQMWNTDLPTSGYNPILPLYNLTAEANGDDYSQMPRPMKIQVSVAGKKDINNMRLTIWDSKAMTWKVIPSVINASARTITGKTSSLGIIGLMENARPIPTFKDTNSIWAKDVIINMAGSGIVKGFSDGTYLPYKGVTRAEFVTLIANTLGWTGNTTALQFKDTIPAWAKESIAEAVARGVVKGYDDGCFHPEKVITRAEMSVIIDKALSLSKSNKPSNYSDAKAIPSWAVQSIRNTKASGLMQGNNNLFRPKAVANRAEAAAVMAKILDYYVRL